MNYHGAGRACLKQGLRMMTGGEVGTGGDNVHSVAIVSKNGVSLKDGTCGGKIEGWRRNCYGH